MARRARKRHVQESFEFRTWGGKRKGAGRRPKGKKPSERHELRPDLDVGSVLLITLRAEADVPADGGVDCLAPRRRASSPTKRVAAARAR